jgi:hypothetical protein
MRAFVRGGEDRLGTRPWDSRGVGMSLCLEWSEANVGLGRLARNVANDTYR